MYKFTGKTDYITEKWAGCDVSHQVFQEGELGRNEASACTDRFVIHKVQQFKFVCRATRTFEEQKIE